MLAHVFLSLLVLKHCLIRIRFAIFDFFCFCFMNNKYLLILFNFERYFSLQTQFFHWWETYAMKIAPETVFHETLWKKSFTVYPCLNTSPFGWLTIKKNTLKSFTSKTLHKKYSLIQVWIISPYARHCPKLLKYLRILPYVLDWDYNEMMKKYCG